MTAGQSLLTDLLEQIHDADLNIFKMVLTRMQKMTPSKVYPMRFACMGWVAQKIDLWKVGIHYGCSSL